MLRLFFGQDKLIMNTHKHKIQHINTKYGILNITFSI